MNGVTSFFPYSNERVPELIFKLRVRVWLMSLLLLSSPLMLLSLDTIQNSEGKNSMALSVNSNILQK